MRKIANLVTFLALPALAMGALMAAGPGAYPASAAPNSSATPYPAAESMGPVYGPGYNQRMVKRVTGLHQIFGPQDDGVGCGDVLGGRGSISGHVTSADGTPLAGIDVTAYNSDAGYGVQATTNANGDYVLSNMLTGSFFVAFGPGQPALGAALTSPYAREWYPNASEEATAQRVDVWSDYNTPDIDAQLEEGGHITGRLIGLNSTIGISNVRVLLRNGGSYDYYHTWTNSAGNFTTVPLKPGIYSLTFSTLREDQSEKLSRFNSGFQFIGQDNAVTATVTGLSDIDIGTYPLQAGALITGVIRYGALLTQTTPGYVYAYTTDTPPQKIAQYVTNSDGKYFLRVPSGTYKIRYEFPYNIRAANAQPVIPQWYNSTGNVLLSSAAESIVVTAPEEATVSRDFTYQYGGIITGTIKDVVTSDSVIAAAEVYDAASGEYIGFGRMDNGASSPYTGTYALQVGLPAGNYVVGFRSTFVEPYFQQWYNAVKTKPEALPVSVPGSGIVPNINAVMKACSSLAPKPTPTPDFAKTATASAAKTATAGAVLNPQATCQPNVRCKKMRLPLVRR